MFNPFMGNNPNSMMNIMNQFQNFKMGFQGDPKQIVQDLLNSGQMTQEQLNQLMALASQFQGMMRK